VKRICFRADADSSIGYGHVVRSGALASALKEHHGLESLLWTRSPVSFDLAMEQRLVPPTVAAEAEGAWIAGQGDTPFVMVLDLWRAPAEQVAGYGSNRPWKLVCFDDESEIGITCDIRVNPSFGGQETQVVPGTGRYLTGGAHLLLRREFAGLPPHDLRPLPVELLVCFGGSDALDLSGRLVSAWSLNWPAQVRRVTLVLGPGYSRAEALVRAVERNPRWLILRAVPAMAHLMQSADIGLFTASTLLYEAVATGLPALLISVNDGQRKEAEEAARLGVAVNLGRAGDLQLPLLADAVSDLLESDRTRISRRGQALVDGLGCLRIADAVAGLVAPYR
jgi:UDP-2,4-diacetamido-2,4,6-trideoxy-beta-L-altropyranose hydrolase